MNKNTKMFLITSLFIVLIGISCVTAVDTDDSTEAISTIDSIEELESTTTDAINYDDNIVTKNVVTENIKTSNSTSSGYIITDESYSNYFDRDSYIIPNTIQDGSTITLSGAIKNKDFTFEDMRLTIKNDGTATLYNTTITAYDTAQITLDGIKIENINQQQDYVILFESEGNILKNSNINVVSDKPIHGIQIDADNNSIINTVIDITAPSADVTYDKNYVGHPATSGIYISSSDNTIDKTTVIFDGTESIGYFPSVDGIDIQSAGNNIIIENNVISNSQITATGSRFVYGINIGRSKNTKMIDTNINATSEYYTNGVQLFDADTTFLSGTIYSTSKNESYGVYSTAMGSGFSKNITMTKLDITVDAPKAIGALIEGSSETFLSDSTYKITGDNATAFLSYVDWMDNIPDGIIAKNLNIDIKGTIDNPVIYFGLCKNVNITDNTINSKKGSEIKFIRTTGASVTNNYIKIANDIIGDSAVVSDSNDTVINNNKPYTYIVTDTTYSTYFDEEGVAKKDVIPKGTTLTLSGDINNKEFIFDNIKANVVNDGTATLYNTTITTQNNAQVSFDGLKIDNTNQEQDYVILLESARNVITNSNINIISQNPVQAIKIEENKNGIKNTEINIKAPSSDVVYNADYSIGNAATSGIFIRSSNNLLSNVKLTYDGKEQTGWFPSVDGIDIQSKAVGETVNNNLIKNSVITVIGSNYAYGINMGRSKNTTVIGTKINVTSDYYADAIQLFDADTTSIRGKVFSTGASEAYGVYSTAMATGISQNINLTSLNMNVKAPNPTAVLYEGSNNILLADSKYTVDGANASAIVGQIDWMGNIPKGLTAKNLYITLLNNKDKYVSGFYNAEDIELMDNTIKSQKGSQINFTKTTGVKVHDNYINIGNEYLGDDGVVSDKDAIVQDNTPDAKQEPVITMDEVKQVVFRDNITISGKITNKDGKALNKAEITIKYNGEEQVVKANSKGVFMATFQATKTGTQDATITSASYSKYKATTTTIPVTVDKRESVVTISDIPEVSVGKTFKIKGRALSDDGLRLRNIKVNVKVNDAQSTVTTDQNGVYYINYTASKIGQNTVTVTYAGNTKYENSAASSTFTVVSKN